MQATIMQRRVGKREQPQCAPSLSGAQWRSWIELPNHKKNNQFAFPKFTNQRERGQQLSTAFTSLPAFSVQSESLPFQNNRTTELHLLPIPEDRSGLILVNLLNFRAFAESSLVALAVQKEHLSELQLVSMSGPQ